eukprot:TRINITY_DN22474_c0_g1_i1.p1 TRINITY_DN22474_c0_g1~~TRINITY_DN22474_c0_g1_i1.p1  ORF type:complete len:415 (+),score=69.73 TRINITY_DN22474_c0_g1_i1:38-1282(+)
MKLARQTFVAGGYITPFLGKGRPDFIHPKHPDHGKKTNPTLKDYVVQPVHELFKQFNIDGSVVDKGYIGNFVGELFCNQGHLGAALAGAHPTLQHKPMTRTEGACASGGLAFVSGVDAIQAGADVVLVSGVEVQNTANARIGADYLARASDYDRQRGIDEFTFPAVFAMRVKEALTRTDMKDDDINKVVLKAYANANKNPLAHMWKVNMTPEKVLQSPCFLGNEQLNPYLRVSQCSQVSDGAAVLLLVSEEGMKKINVARQDCTQLLSYGHACGSLYEEPDLLNLTTTQAAANAAYASAGLKPTDMGVGEVHDCFAITEILMYEALGLAASGKGSELVRDGATELDGKIPINTGGGLVAFGHPVGATGVKQILEVHKQLKGQAGDYQVKNSPNYGITANMGGDDRTSVVSILGQ